jgi:hypothetical protein
LFAIAVTTSASVTFILSKTNDIGAKAALLSMETAKEFQMPDQIKGLHHVTSMAKDAHENNEFFTRVGFGGLRRPSISMRQTSTISTTRMNSARRVR